MNAFIWKQWAYFRHEMVPAVPQNDKNEDQGLGRLKGKLQQDEGDNHRVTESETGQQFLTVMNIYKKL